MGAEWHQGAPDWAASLRNGSRVLLSCRVALVALGPAPCRRHTGQWGEPQAWPCSALAQAVPAHSRVWSEGRTQGSLRSPRGDASDRTGTLVPKRARLDSVPSEHRDSALRLSVSLLLADEPWDAGVPQAPQAPRVGCWRPCWWEAERPSWGHPSSVSVPARVPWLCHPSTETVFLSWRAYEGAHSLSTGLPYRVTRLARPTRPTFQAC